MEKLKPYAIIYKDYVIKLYETTKKVTIILNCGNVDCKNVKEAKKLIDLTVGLHA